jgi:hypothetical protein
MLQRLLMVLMVGTAGLLMLAVGYFGYDYYCFLPHRARIEGLLVLAEREDRAPPPMVSSLLRLSLQEGTAACTARLLLDRLDVQEPPVRPTGWQFTRAMWTSLVALHIPEQEQLSLIAALAPMGQGRRGLSAEARLRFGKPLSALNLEQAATLVTLAANATRDPAWLDRQRDWLVAQYAGTGGG